MESCIHYNDRLSRYIVYIYGIMHIHCRYNDCPPVDGGHPGGPISPRARRSKISSNRRSSSRINSRSSASLRRASSKAFIKSFKNLDISLNYLCVHINNLHTFQAVSALDIESLEKSQLAIFPEPKKLSNQAGVVQRSSRRVCKK